MSIAIDQAVDNLTFQTSNDSVITLSDLKGKHLVLYFYPKDHTPGCTLESQDFRDLYAAFKRANCEILGISRDSIASHKKFSEKHCFPFELVSDPDEVLCNYFDVIKNKNMYGKKVRGIERSTFLIDSKGVLRKEWRKVKVQGHANEVLETVCRF